MKFKSANINRFILAVILTVSGVYCPQLIAATPQGSRGARIMELFEESPEEFECEEGYTEWDDLADQNQSLYENDLASCRERDPSTTDEECLTAPEARWQGNILDALDEIYDDFAMIEVRSEDPQVDGKYIEYYVKNLKKQILKLLVMKDNFENSQLFSKIFDQAIKQMSSNSIPEIMQNGSQEMIQAWKVQHQLRSVVLNNDKELYRTFLNFKNLNVFMPYGKNVCEQKKVNNAVNSKTASQCFVVQDSFVESVKSSRRMELDYYKKSGNRKPLINGVKKESLEPCGTVLGMWQATSSGRILRTSLMIKVPGAQKPIPFDVEVLQKLIQKVDYQLANE